MPFGLAAALFLRMRISRQLTNPIRAAIAVAMSTATMTTAVEGPHPALPVLGCPLAALALAAVLLGTGITKLRQVTVLFISSAVETASW